MTTARREYRRHSEATKARARELRAQGWSQRRIAAELDMALGSVQRWTDPKQLARQNESGKRLYERNGHKYRAQQREYKRRAVAALKRERRDALARSATGGLPEAYALIRKLAVQVENEPRLIPRVYDLEDELVALMRERAR